MCRADVPRVPEQFPEAGETLEDRLGHASPRIARPAVKTRAGVPFVDPLGVTNRVPPPIDARVCRRSLSRPRNGGRDLSGRREVSSSTFESPEAAQTKTLNPGFVGSQTPLSRRAVIRSDSNLRRHSFDTRECGVQDFPRFFFHDESKYSYS